MLYDKKKIDTHIYNWTFFFFFRSTHTLRGNRTRDSLNALIWRLTSSPLSLTPRMLFKLDFDLRQEFKSRDIDMDH